MSLFAKLLQEQLDVPDIGSILKIKKDFDAKKVTNLYNAKKEEPITIPKGTKMTVLDVDGSEIEMKPDKQNVVVTFTMDELKKNF